MKHLSKSRLLTVGCLLALASVMVSAQAASSAVRFGVQPWPGVTVKSEVAAQLLEALGYDVEQSQLNTPITLNGLANGEPAFQAVQAAYGE